MYGNKLYVYGKVCMCASDLVHYIIYLTNEVSVSSNIVS